MKRMEEELAEWRKMVAQISETLVEFRRSHGERIGPRLKEE